MTSITTSRREGQSHKNISNDDNTSDESLLLMVDNIEEKAPLLNMMDDEIDRSPTMPMDDIPLRSRSLTSHCQTAEEPFDYKARNRLIIVLILCLIFMIIEIVGGVLSNSTAVITDAAHMCIDATGFLISLAAMYLATKAPTDKLSFGYIRAEVLGALLSVLTIWLATGILVFMAIDRCIHRDFEVRPTEMIVVASCGVIFNIVMFFVLHANVCGHGLPHHGHSHDHGSHAHLHDPSHHHHSHSDDSLIVDVVSGDEHTPSPSDNINVRAAIIHVIGDFVQSIGVLFAAILIKIKPEYKLADPICTFAFSILVLITTITIMRDIVRILMEGVPSHLNYNSILNALLRLPGVRNAHSLHIWSLSMQKTALSVHIAIDVGHDQFVLLDQTRELLRREYGITRTTIQVEVYDAPIVNAGGERLPPRT